MGYHRDLKGPALHAPTNERVENNTGSTIQKLQVVSLDAQGNIYPQVVLANPNVRKSFGVSLQEITDTSNGYVTTIGFLVNVDTSAWAVNNALYSDASGNLTTTPLGNPVAKVMKSDIGCGILYVLALGDNFSDAANPWLLDGNAGTDPNVNFTGTTDNKGYTLRTFNEQRMRIDANGRFLFGDKDEVDPKWFMHLKQHSGFAGSGNMKETAAVEVSDTAINNIYSFAVPNYATVMATIRIVAIEEDNSNQATFIRSGTWFRQGGNAQQMGVLQSDYTNKSDNDFDVSFSKTAETVFVNIKNANPISTRWMITVELDIMLNDAP